MQSHMNTVYRYIYSYTYMYMGGRLPINTVQYVLYIWTVVYWEVSCRMCLNTYCTMNKS